MTIAAAHDALSSRTGPVECESAAVGERLRKLRLDAGLTQAALAQRLGTTQSAVARLEAGQQRMSLVALKRAALALGCDVQVVIAERGA